MLQSKYAVTLSENMWVGGVVEDTQIENVAEDMQIEGVAEGRKGLGRRCWGGCSRGRGRSCGVVRSGVHGVPPWWEPEDGCHHSVHEPIRNPTRGRKAPSLRRKEFLTR